MSKIKQTVEKVIHMLRHAQHETEKLQYFQALLRSPRACRKVNGEFFNGL